MRGTRGSLRDLPMLPLDVLFEIFEHMHPKDLLNLSRTSRNFRAFLLNRANVGLWRAARSNVPGLPECPPFLSEPAYANVVFFSSCHVCSKIVPQLERVYIEFGARYCKQCEEKMLVDPDVDEEIDNFLDDLAEFMNDDGKKDEVELPLLFTHFNPSKLLRSQFAEFRAQWDASSDNEARKKLIEDEAKRTKEVETWADTFYTWAHGKKSARLADLAKLRRDRVIAILDRLRQEGWEEELALPQNEDLDDSLAREKFANKPAELTDKAWEKIRDEANRWIGTIRARRLHVARRKILTPRFAVFSKFIKSWTSKNWPVEDDQDEPIPVEGIKDGDWLLMPGIQSFLDHLNDKVKLTNEYFESAVEDGFFDPVELAYAWYRERKADLVGILERSIGLPELRHEEDDPLELAIHSFDCTFCDEKFMVFPEVLRHRCRRRIPSESPQVGLDHKTMVQTYLSLECILREWSPELVRINPRMFPDKARALIRRMGLNPESATHEAMNRCRTRLTCADCGRKPNGKYEVFDWKRALLHQDSERHFSSSQPCTWVVLPEEVAEAVRNHESALKQADSNNHYRTVCCYRCNVLRCRSHIRYYYYYEREELLAHLKREHGVSGEEVTDDSGHYVRWEQACRPLLKVPPYVYFSHSASGGIVVSHGEGTWA